MSRKSNAQAQLPRLPFDAVPDLLIAGLLTIPRQPDEWEMTRCEAGEIIDTTTSADLVARIVTESVQGFRPLLRQL